MTTSNVQVLPNEMRVFAPPVMRERITLSGGAAEVQLPHPALLNVKDIGDLKLWLEFMVSRVERLHVESPDYHPPFVRHLMPLDKVKSVELEKEVSSLGSPFSSGETKPASGVIWHAGYYRKKNGDVRHLIYVTAARAEFEFGSGPNTIRATVSLSAWAEWAADATWTRTAPTDTTAAKPCEKHDGSDVKYGYYRRANGTPSGELRQVTRIDPVPGKGIAVLVNHNGKLDRIPLAEWRTWAADADFLGECPF